ncbi:hypothetical protein CY0110_16947 [Crocosphaera chwakensis CCY0110]|uniref:Uncharacterized protein n=1 Tax=Crocosphaera chwakensis CCY0110 TaxID=391612 RepID=A3II71_9CHRO|nr:hypothetical protein CY0110_16947 [Crocosphaera chwakensis CCY0110]
MLWFDFYTFYQFQLLQECNRFQNQALTVDK